MISAATVRPLVDFKFEPSPARSTSPRVILSPALPSSFSTTILSPGATRYCLPPVRTTANIGSSLLPVEIRLPRACGRKTLGRAESEPPMAVSRRCQPRGGGPSLVAARQQEQVSLAED